MKLKYTMNTEMWVVGAGNLKRGDVIEEHDQKKIDKFLRTGMFKKIKTKIKHKKIINKRSNETIQTLREGNYAINKS